ncbi:apolipoprotein D-like [Scylla paramamosain]|uniref:apolipoprotein D-like n=1 Tax=Scylla paramamosain TaxID=85552 RepID=UPI003082E142
MQAAGRSVAVAVVVVGVLASTTTAHVMGLGSCRKFDGMKDFDPARFTGTWYVLNKLGTRSDCLSVTYNLTEDGQGFRVKEVRRPPYSDIIPLDLVVTNVGSLKSRGAASEFIATWENSFLPDMKSDYRVIDTDYDNYAIDYECHQVAFIKRRSATILSRQKELNPELIEQLKETLITKFDVPGERLNTIDQSTCIDTEANDFNVVIDEKGLSSAYQEMDRLAKLPYEKAAKEIAKKKE